MKKVIAAMADNYGLYDLHRKYSTIDQFYYDEDEVIQLNQDYSKFYFRPMLPELQFEDKIKQNGYINGKLKFLSQIENGDSNKQAIFHYNLSTEEEKINVIMIHGWRSEQLNRLENVFLKDFIKQRYNIYRYILPFHMERCPSTSYSGEYFISSNINRTLKSIQQSVNDIRALIRYIKENGKGKIVLIGLSLGGLITNLVCEFEEEIDLLVSLFYANSLSFTIFETIPGKFIKKDFCKHNFDVDLLKECWKVVNPSLRKPVIDLDKIFLVSGVYDKYVLDKDTDTLWENWGKPERKLFGCGHSGVVLNKNQIRNETLDFINKKE